MRSAPVDWLGRFSIRTQYARQPSGVRVCRDTESTRAQANWRDRLLRGTAWSQPRQPSASSHQLTGICAHTCPTWFSRWPAACGS